MVRHLPTVSRLVAPLVDPEAKPWLAGARGEQRVAAVVEHTIRRHGGELVCDVVVSKESIDLVAVLPTGVFVIEVKHWSGAVTLRDDVMFHGGPSPDGYMPRSSARGPSSQRCSALASTAPAPRSISGHPIARHPPTPGWLAAFTRRLVDDHFIAGAHETQMIRSIYRWQGEDIDKPEARVALHTRTEHIAAIIDRANAEHPYDVPCVVALPIVAATPRSTRHGLLQRRGALGTKAMIGSGRGAIPV